MSIIRSERAAAIILLAAATLGLIAANSVIGPSLLALQTTHLPLPGTPLDLSVGHWISEGLLSVFFFIVAVELKNELTCGELNTFSRAVRPAIAALGGVLVPAIIYFAFTVKSGHLQGWPIPTATDIAFALGVLAIFGKGIPARLRIFLLAIAILDDIIAILIIAVFFTNQPNLFDIAAATVGVTAFGLLSLLLKTRSRTIVAIGMGVIALLTWALTYQSGVHATIAGVALGLVMARKPALHVRHALEPFSNGFILPLFAFSAALVTFPPVPVTDLAPPFWGILVALPVGKLIGIGFGGWLSSFFTPRNRKPQLTFGGLMTVGALGGIGFTVSLLMNELAFANSPEIANEGTLAVLLGSMISIGLSAILVSHQAVYYQRLRALRVATRQAISSA
jgi:NhaA family Na+:H+ antiporter